MRALLMPVLIATCLPISFGGQLFHNASAHAGPVRVADAREIVPWLRPRHDGEVRLTNGPITLPDQGAQCRESLRAMGASFAEIPPVTEAEFGCEIGHPVLLDGLGQEVSLQPPALLACAAAQATAEFVRDILVPAAAQHLGARPTAVVQLSAYVCRARHETDVLSQHAFGNALDWGAIILDDGRTIAVRQTDEPRPAAFLDELRRAACGIFTTVLGPGTDAFHADHFHFDITQRRRPYCR